MANYALIKNSKVVQIIVANSMPNEFALALKAEFSIDEVVLCDDTPACIDADYDGTNFWPPKPYPSWVWDEANKCWVTPIAYPDDKKIYNWNEETQAWDLFTPPTI